MTEIQVLFLDGHVRKIKEARQDAQGRTWFIDTLNKRHAEETVLTVKGPVAA